MSDSDCLSISEAFSSETIEKGTTLTNTNKLAGKILFIECGLIRISFLNDGKDISHFFFDENDFIAAVDSILYNKSERYIWQALETCNIRMIAFHDILSLMEKYPKLTQVIIEYTLKLLDVFSQKMNLAQFQSATDRYASFLEMYPNLSNRVSLGNIASFLGITQQTLSVIRSNKR